MRDAKIEQISFVSDSLCNVCYYIADRAGGMAQDVERRIQTDININKDILIVHRTAKGELTGFIKGNIDETSARYNISAIQNLKTARIEWIYIDGKFQRQGIGHQLIDGFTNYVQRNGVQAVYAAISDTKQARKFYKKEGFAKVRADTLFYKILTKNEISL